MKLNHNQHFGAGISAMLKQLKVYLPLVLILGIILSCTPDDLATSPELPDPSVATLAALRAGDIPQDLVAESVGTCPVDSSQVALSWNPVTGASNYQVYQDEVLVTTSTGTNTVLSNVVPGRHVFGVKACNGAECSEAATVTVTVEGNLATIITTGRIPSDLSGYDQTSRNIFSQYAAGDMVAARYVKEGGTGDGSSYAEAAGNVKTVLDGITDARASNVYVVLVTPGTYDAKAEMAMKNNVAIVGGVSECLQTVDTPTILSGGGTHRVFNNSGLTSTATLYGVTIADGKGDYGGGMNNNYSSPVLTRVTFSRNSAVYGGGMNNYYSSPVLTEVTLVNNTVNGGGGGMYNDYSSPVLTGVTFSENSTSLTRGGGLYNIRSTPILNRVTFSGNTANRGAGVYNFYSAPVLTGVTFSGNTANYGGGMYNRSSSTVMIGVTFFNNRVSTEGGALYMDNNSEDNGENNLMVNTVFWGNRVTRTGGYQGHVAFIYDKEGYPPGNKEYTTERFHLYNSVVQEGMPAGYVSGTASSHFRGSFYTGYGAGAVIYFSNIITSYPRILPLADNGGGVLTHAIPANSSAVNQGLYVKRSAAPTRKGCDIQGKNLCDIYNYYFSEDGVAWYSDLSLTTVATPPGDAVDLTATDATGNRRTGRPDIGAYEAKSSTLGAR